MNIVRFYIIGLAIAYGILLTATVAIGQTRTYEINRCSSTAEMAEILKVVGRERWAALGKTIVVWNEANLLTFTFNTSTLEWCVDETFGT